MRAPTVGCEIMWDESDLLPGLTVTSGPWQGVSFRLRPGVWLIGRHEDADFVLADPKVSRRHARVELVDGRVLVDDLGSTNGTWLNDRRIAEVTELHDGDRLRLGQIRLRYFDPSTATTDPVGSLALRSLRMAVGGQHSGVNGSSGEPAGRSPGAEFIPAMVGDGPAGGRWPDALAAPTQAMATATRSAGARLAILLAAGAGAAAGAVAVFQLLW